MIAPSGSPHFNFLLLFNPQSLLHRRQFLYLYTSDLLDIFSHRLTAWKKPTYLLTDIDVFFLFGFFLFHSFFFLSFNFFFFFCILLCAAINSYVLMRFFCRRCSHNQGYDFLSLQWDRSPHTISVWKLWPLFCLQSHSESPQVEVCWYATTGVPCMWVSVSPNGHSQDPCCKA